MDLFEQFDALFRGDQIDPVPSPFALNRFLASDKDYAEAAKVIVKHTLDPKFTWTLWQMVLPRRVHGAPRMKYVAPKKADEVPTALVARIMEVDGVRQDIAREKVALAELMDNMEPELAAYEGMVLQLEYHYGVEPEGAEDGDETSAG